MGWSVTVKAGRVRDMKNKRKTGKKRGWSGASGGSGGSGPEAGLDNTATAPATGTVPSLSAGIIPLEADNTTASRGIIPADNDGKEDNTTLPATRIKSSITNLPSDTNPPIVMATAAASSPISPISPDKSIATGAPTTAPVDSTVATAPNTTLTIAPTGTIPEPLHISFAQIQEITHDPTTNSTTYKFDNGKSITTEPLNKQEYKCTFSPSPNLNA